jgi:hypothetical protein
MLVDRRSAKRNCSTTDEENLMYIAVKPDGQNEFELVLRLATAANSHWNLPTRRTKKTKEPLPLATRLAAIPHSLALANGLF